MTREQAERIRAFHGYDLVTAITREGRVVFSAGDGDLPHGGSLACSLMGDAQAVADLFAALEPGVPRNWMQGELGVSVVRLPAGAPKEAAALCLWSFRGSGVERILRLEAQAEEVAREVGSA